VIERLIGAGVLCVLAARLSLRIGRRERIGVLQPEIAVA
jgi:hypothetical protein